MAVKDQIRTFILNNYLFTDDKASLKDEQSFLDSGIIDSIGVMEIVLYLETEFDIKVADADISPENLDSVNQITQFIDLKRDSLEV